MQKYFLHLNYLRECVQDPDGAELPDLETAKSDARDTIREMAADALRAKRKFTLTSIRVGSESGQLLAEVSVAETLAEVIGVPFANTSPPDHHV
ncbi:hypothetical protein [Rhizobium sp. NFR03]|uniref:DUF6894 family protein n=1 Tax=Rhizobium sp. NFR03 TaxID=1566263 RepID=UPI000AEF6E14|nr:hypothetical protein [Rhizobium sp. NFR03]